MKTNEITYEELLESKRYVSESGIAFPSYRELIDPFLKEVDENNIDTLTIETAAETKNAEEDERLNIAYGKLSIKARLIDRYDIGSEFNSDIGMLISMVGQKPIIRVFSGKNVTTCMNLCIFNAKHVFTQDLLGSRDNAYDKVRTYKDEVDAELEWFSKKVEILKTTHYDGDSLNSLIGYVFSKGIKNGRIGTTIPVSGTRLLFDPASRYALQDGSTSAWNYYNAMTEVLKKEDMIKMPEKNYLVSDTFFEYVNRNNPLV